MADGSAATPGDRPAPRNAVVAGGTGLVGGALLPLLGADARYHRVTSLVRRATPAPPGVTVQRVDFERLDQVVVPDVDDAFCCLGTTRRAAGSATAFRRVDFDYVAAFGRLAKRSGAALHVGLLRRCLAPFDPSLHTHEGRRRSGDRGPRVRIGGDPAAVVSDREPR